MEFSEFREGIYKKWQKSLLRLCWCGVLLVFVFELSLFIAFYTTKTLVSPLSSYLLLRLILPSSISVMTAIAFTIVLRSNSFTVFQKNRAASHSIFMLCSVVGIFHNYYKFLLVTIGLPVFVCAIFADKWLLRTIFRLSLASFVIALVFMWFDDIRLATIDFITTAVCAFIFMLVVYVLAKALLIYQAEQINFVYNTSSHYIALIHDLKIEPLTKLYNRSALNDAVCAFVRKFNAGIYKPHLALIDLDNFKEINDIYGHDCGDSVLAEFASIVKKELGTMRRAFRYGGEEFVLLFENETTDQVKTSIQNIRNGLKETSFAFAPKKQFSFSAGVALLQANWDEITWFNAADSAMYKAKESGKDMTVVIQEV